MVGLGAGKALRGQHNDLATPGHRRVEAEGLGRVEAEGLERRMGGWKRGTRPAGLGWEETGIMRPAARRVPRGAEDTLEGGLRPFVLSYESPSGSDHPAP